MPTVLFLRTPGPGALFLFVERNAPASVRPATLRLSDPAPPALWRACGVSAPLADALAERLADAFGPQVARLDWDESGWRWAADGDSGGGPAAASPGALSRLPGWPRTPAPWEAWAARRGFPLSRLTDRRVPEVDYATVAGLDQRSLLVENGPRLYRYELAAPV